MLNFIFKILVFSEVKAVIPPAFSTNLSISTTVRTIGQGETASSVDNDSRL